MTAQDFSSIEKLLGLEEGSTNNGIPANLVESLDNKTKEITEAFDKNKTIQNLPPAEIIKTGITLDELEEDRKSIVKEAKMIYEISKKILHKLYDDMKDKIVTSDRMYDAASKLIASVIASNKALKDINTQYRQEEEMRRMSEISIKEDEVDGKKMKLSPAETMAIILEHRKHKGLKEASIQAQDAEIVSPTQGEQPPKNPESEV